MFKNEFSWSALRLSIFMECPLAYYYHYYASWGGWETTADADTVLAYRLKNLQTVNSWVLKTFKQTIITSTLHHTKDIRKTRRNAFSALHRDICDIRNKEYMNDPKGLNIDRLYYRESTLSKIISEAEAILNSIFANFADSKFHTLIEEIPFLNIKKFTRPASFYCDSIKVWSNPDLVWEENGILYILNIFISEPSLTDHWAIKSGIDAIFAETKWQNRKVEVISLFPNLPPPLPFISITRNRKELKALIRQSSEDMLRLTKLDTDIQKTEFAKLANYDNCEICRFRQLCKKTKERDHIHL